MTVKRGERDRLADPAHRLDDGLVGRQASSELLADAEHQEHAVVRPGAQDQHDEQELGDRRDLDADLRRLGDDRPGEDQHECRRQERHDRRERRAEGEQQQHDDEQQREQRVVDLRGSRRGDRVDLGRQLAGQVDLETGGDAGPGERPADRVDDALRLGTAGERDDRGLDERLACLAILRDAQVRDDLDLVDAADLLPRSRSIAALSAAVSPPSRAATRVAAARDASWNGAAMAAACMLGVLAGRNPLVVSLATSLRDGRSRTARIVTTIQATTTRNRKRTVNCPRPTKKLLNRSLLGTSRCGSCGVPRRRVRGIRTLGG